MVEYNPNYKKLTAGAIDFIYDFFAKNGKDTTPAVIGISGGKDSTITAKLLVEALGKDRVIGVLMPNGIQHDIDVSKKVVEYLGIKSYTVNIEDMVKAFKFNVDLHTDFDITDQARINLPPRIRMTLLYYINACVGGFVANTSNLSEDWVGYATLWGDSVGDFSVLSMLTVEEVKQIGYELGIPKEFIEKTPEDGLTGKSDEEFIGVSYQTIDNYIARDNMIPTLEERNLIKRKFENSRYKFRPMAMYQPNIKHLYEHILDEEVPNNEPVYRPVPGRLCDTRWQDSHELMVQSFS